MAPAYKLTYFPLQGLAESIRFLLSYGGIEFEDVRVEADAWLKIKGDTPFGQLPILELNGKIANQSIAIARYIAKQVKLVGKNDWEDLEIDAIVDTISDLGTKLAQYRYEQNATLKESRKETLLNETLPYYLGRLDKIAQKNKGYLAVGRLTWADIVFTTRCEAFSKFMDMDALEDYPNLRVVRDNVTSLPAIKAWIAKRPKSDY